MKVRPLSVLVFLVLFIVQRVALCKGLFTLITSSGIKRCTLPGIRYHRLVPPPPTRFSRLRNTVNDQPVRIASGMHPFFLKFLWGRWYPWFGLLVTFPPGFRARVGNLICTWRRHMCYMFPKISPLVRHLPTCWQPTWQSSQSLPHTCKQALVGLETRTYLPQTNSLPTELCQLGSSVDPRKWVPEPFQSVNTTSMMTLALGLNKAKMLYFVTKSYTFNILEEMWKNIQTKNSNLNQMVFATMVKRQLVVTCKVLIFYGVFIFFYIYIIYIYLYLYFLVQSVSILIIH